MNLPIPVVGVTAGSSYATLIDSCLTIIDGHTHTAGSGVAITPAAININANLTMGNNSLTNIAALTLTSQVTSFPNLSIYSDGTDLFYTDGNGNAVKLTSGGLVNATSSGISSGTASASFIAGVLVVNAAANTPANIQGASLLMGNNIASSNYLTLSPPNAMGTSYTLVLPALPASQKIMTLDNSGNMGAPYTVDGSSITIMANVIGVPTGGITTAKIADQNVTQAKLALRTVSSTAPAGGVATSGSVSQSYGTGVTNQAISGLSVSLVTTGRPVFVGLIDDGAGSLGDASSIRSNGGGASFFQIFRGGTQLTFSTVSAGSNAASLPPSSLSVLDYPTAGTYTYSVSITGAGGAGTIGVSRVVLIAYEL